MCLKNAKIFTRFYCNHKKIHYIYKKTQTNGINVMKKLAEKIKAILTFKVSEVEINIVKDRDDKYMAGTYALWLLGGYLLKLNLLVNKIDISGRPRVIIRVAPLYSFDLCKVYRKEFLIPSIRQIKTGAKRKFESAKLRAVDVITMRKVYYWYTAYDCDMTYVEYGCEYKNIFDAEKCIDEAYESAEGRTTFERITKADYEESEAVCRDLALEAFENGHPHSVHL